jgi:hypothetical protein
MSRASGNGEMPFERRHDRIRHPTLADAVLGSLAHNARGTAPEPGRARNF